MGADRELHLEFEEAVGQSPPISKAGLTAGRAPGCDLVLDSPTCSDRHARLHQCGEHGWAGRGWGVLGSRQGRTSQRSEHLLTSLFLSL